MTRSWKLSTAAAVLALGTLGLGAHALAEGPRHGRGCGKPGLERLERQVDRLELDDATRASADALFDRARADRRAQREVIRSARERMHELLAQEQPQLEAVLAQADAVGALETEAQKARLRTMIELRALLGPERWAEIAPKHDRGPRS